MGSAFLSPPAGFRVPVRAVVFFAAGRMVLFLALALLGFGMIVFPVMLFMISV